MRLLGLLGIVFWGLTARAACPVADTIARTEGLDKALPVYVTCALHDNDDETQVYLAQVYEKGSGAVAKNVQRALLFYHLAVENGNATAMVGMSKLLTALDAEDSTRAEIPVYLTKIQAQTARVIGRSFNGQLLHPYALLALAAEKPEAKWFYPTQFKADPTAAKALKDYPITPEKKKAALKQASQWKQRRMLDIAREVMTVREFNRFYETLYPDTGIPNAFAREQAINQLKERIKKDYETVY